MKYVAIIMFSLVIYSFTMAFAMNSSLSLGGDSRLLADDILRRFVSTVLVVGPFAVISIMVHWVAQR